MIVLQGPAGNELVMHTSTELLDADHHILQDVVGWYGGVGVTGDNTQRTGHGLFPEPSRRTGRALTVKGIIVFGDPDLRALTERRLSAVFWDGELGTVTVDDGHRVLSCEAKLDGEPGFERVGKTALRVEVPLIAPDPFLYGQRRQSPLYPPGYGEGVRLSGGPFEAGVIRFYGGPPPGGVLTNEGNATAWPSFTVRGSWPSGFRISSGRKSVTFPAPVFEQSPVEVDMRTGSISVNGKDQTHLASRREWFSIPAGGAITVQANQFAPSEGWVDCYVRDTYI